MKFLSVLVIFAVIVHINCSTPRPAGDTPPEVPADAPSDVPADTPPTTSVKPPAPAPAPTSAPAETPATTSDAEPSPSDPRTGTPIIPRKCGTVAPPIEDPCAKFNNTEYKSASNPCFHPICCNSVKFQCEDQSKLPISQIVLGPGCFCADGFAKLDEECVAANSKACGKPAGYYWTPAGTASKRSLCNGQTQMISCNDEGSVVSQSTFG